MKPVVFDSWAILAFLNNEPQAEKVELIIENLVDDNIPFFIHEVNLGEIWYIAARKHGIAKADSTCANLLSLGLSVVGGNWTIARQAGIFKMRGGLSFADSFAAALAFDKSGILVTGDYEFKQVSDSIEINWLR